MAMSTRRISCGESIPRHSVSRSLLTVMIWSATGMYCIEFLQHLLREMPTKLIVIWDGSPIHRRTEVKPFVGNVGEDRLVVVQLPPYAPALNPVE
jgi:hypothetical protein